MHGKVLIYYSWEARTSEYPKWYSKKDFGDLQSWKSEKTSKEKASGSESILLKSLCFRKKKLFMESKSDKLDVPKEELENHLKMTYSDDLNGIPIPPLRDLPKPQDPTVMFDNSGIKLKEVQDFVHKARAGSAPGLNGISYKLYKNCPHVLRKLTVLLQQAWKKGIKPQEWCLADGIWIPKEMQSKGITNFCPISLLNVEGKIFFGVLAHHMTTFLMSNHYINTSVMKVGIPGFPGCLEHSQMILNSILSARRDKTELQVIWLDLANAYGSVPHHLIWMAFEFFNFPSKVGEIIMKYFNSAFMKFTVKNYTTKWQALEIGIMMGCVISPLLFVLAMELILQGAANTSKGVMKTEHVTLPPSRAFMDNITILVPSQIAADGLLQRYYDLFTWARMKAKPKKNQSLSLVGGSVREIHFKIGGDKIPTVREKLVKKKNRYETLHADCVEKGWICHVIPIEVGCRDFIGDSVISFLSKIGITGHSLKVASYRFQTAAQYASSWIWSKDTHGTTFPVWLRKKWLL